MADIVDRERALEGTRAIARPAFPSEARQTGPTLAPGETVESRAEYRRPPERTPITSRGHAELPAGVRQTIVRDPQGRSVADWAEPIYAPPPAEEARGTEARGTEARGTAHGAAPPPGPPPQPPATPTVKPLPAKQRRAPSAEPAKPALPYTVTFDLGTGKDEGSTVLDPAAAAKAQWERRLRYLTDAEWASLMRAMEKRVEHVLVAGKDPERQHTALFYLAVLGVISADEFEALAGSATSQEMLESINPSKLAELAFRLFELKEVVDQNSGGAVELSSDILLVRGPLRPQDEVRREGNRLFRDVFNSQTVRNWNVDDDTLIEDPFYRRGIVKEVRSRHRR